MSKHREAASMLQAAKLTGRSIVITQEDVNLLCDALEETTSSFTDINDLVDAVHKNAVAHGWWEEERTIGELIALCHAELSEALEEARDGHPLDEVRLECDSAFGCEGEPDCNKCGHYKPEGVPVELADCIIRIMDFFGRYKIDLQAVIDVKMKFNATRPHKHGKVF